MDNIISSDQTVAIILIKLNKKWTVIFKNLRLLVRCSSSSYMWITYFISSLNSHQIQSKSLSTVQIHKLLVQVREMENFLPSIIDVWYISKIFNTIHHLLEDI